MSDTPPDIITFSFARPSTGQTVTGTIPPQFTALLDWLAANIKEQDGSARYVYGLNVIWKDVIQYLVPVWVQQYTIAQLSDIRTAEGAIRQQVQETIDAGIAALTVTGP